MQNMEKKQRVRFESNFTTKQFFRPPWAHPPPHAPPQTWSISNPVFPRPQHSCVSPSFYDPNAHVHPPLMSATVVSAHQSHDQSISREEFTQKYTHVLQRPQYDYAVINMFRNRKHIIVLKKLEQQQQFISQRYNNYNSRSLLEETINGSGVGEIMMRMKSK